MLWASLPAGGRGWRVWGLHMLGWVKGHHIWGKGVRHVWPEHGRIRTEAAKLMGRGQARNGTQCQEFELEGWEPAKVTNRGELGQELALGYWLIIGPSMASTSSSGVLAWPLSGESRVWASPCLPGT